MDGSCCLQPCCVVLEASAVCLVHAVRAVHAVHAVRAVCLVHVDNLCDMVLSARGKQKLDKICESFCSSSQVLEPFLDDNDLTEDVRAFSCITLEDLA